MTDNKLQITIVVQKQEYNDDKAQRFDDDAYDAITRIDPDAVFLNKSIQTTGVIEDSQKTIKHILSDETGLIALNYEYEITQGETK